jgi:xylan 1,4-beta-xylosidase
LAAIFWIIKSIIGSYGQINVLSCWLASDIAAGYTDTDSILFGGSGLISRDGIRKPGFFAYSFLARMGENLISKGDGFLVTSRAAGEYEVLLYNYKNPGVQYREKDDLVSRPESLDDLFEDNDSLDLTVRLGQVAAGRYRIRQFSLNSGHGSILDEWRRLHKLENLQPSEIAWLSQTCVPLLSVDEADCAGELTVHSRLEPHGVDLFLISMIL